MIGGIALKPSKVICEKCNGTIESNGELVIKLVTVLTIPLLPQSIKIEHHQPEPR